MILLDEPLPVVPSRGMRRCDVCHMRSMRLRETESHDVETERGAIGATRIWLCTTNGCGNRVVFYDTCGGKTTKGTVRSMADHYGEPSPVAVETAPDRIVLKT